MNQSEEIDVVALLEGPLRRSPLDPENLLFAKVGRHKPGRMNPWVLRLRRLVTRVGRRLGLMAASSESIKPPLLPQRNSELLEKWTPPRAGASIIAWVIPWYGDQIPGGAEAQCRATAKKLQQAGWRVEILTTCVREFQSDWSVNEHPEGVSLEGGLLVRRFRVMPRDAQRFDELNARLMKGERLSLEEETLFMKNMIRSESLVAYMREHASSYVFLPIPYMFGTTLDGALACPDRTFLVPCLHDESYAYLSCFGEMFRAVRGVIYHAHAEKRLAEKLYGLSPDAGSVVGGGIDEARQGSPERFRAKHGSKPFLLYAGRKDSGKNVSLLIEYFCHYKNRFGGDLRLFLIGGGTIEVPSAHRDRDVVDLGFVSSQEKVDAYAAAFALCQPSVMESFSIVTLEAWTAECPALVHRDCAVTREHCELSRGGLAFGSFAEFAACLQYWEQNPDIRGRMGKLGAQYVRENYTWDCVVEKYRRYLEAKGFELA